jgi:putative transposase
MSRGNRKSAIVEDNHDRRMLLELFAEACDRYDVACFSYCLMDNHYHLVVMTPLGNLSMFMRQINGVFTQRSNRRHRRTGHLFEGRFKSLLVDNDLYLRDVCRYVVQNPVRARLASDASAWPWSSYRVTAGLAPPSFVSQDWLDWVFPSRSHKESQRRYRLFINDDVERMVPTVYEGLALGGQEFEEEVREQIGSQFQRTSLPRIYRAIGRPSLAELFLDQQLSKRTRNELILRANVAFGYRLAEIAAHLGLHASTASLVTRRLRAELGSMLGFRDLTPKGTVSAGGADKPAAGSRSGA